MNNPRTRTKLQAAARKGPTAIAQLLTPSVARVLPSYFRWQELCGKTNRIPLPKLKVGNLQTALVISAIVTGLIAGVRSLGFMQQWELSAFDSMMRMRPDEGADDRLLVITVTEADIQDFPIGAYQKFSAGGHQILLNYRSSRQVAKLVSVAQVLNNQFNPDWVKDKIVLIGVDSQSVKDYFLTPYSMATTPHLEIPGVVLHAHMVSQILSAVLDKRSLLWVLPTWGEILWICGSSLVAGILAVYSQSHLY